MSEVHLGTAPFGHICVQLGTPNYELKAREEGETYIDLLKKCFLATGGSPETLEATEFRVVGCPHDFGTYYEVRVVGSFEVVDWIAMESPETWEELRSVAGASCA